MSIDSAGPGSRGATGARRATGPFGLDRSGYAQQVLSAAGVATCAGGWTAAAGLAAPRRRLVRVAIGTALVFLPFPVSVPPIATADAVTAVDDSPRRRIALGATGFAVRAAVALGRRRWERTWLQRLHHRGHPHPHRAAGRRVALLVFAHELAHRLVRVRRVRQGRDARSVLTAARRGLLGTPTPPDRAGPSPRTGGHDRPAVRVAGPDDRPTVDRLRGGSEMFAPGPLSGPFTG